MSAREKESSPGDGDVAASASASAAPRVGTERQNPFASAAPVAVLAPADFVEGRFQETVVEILQELEEAVAISPSFEDVIKGQGAFTDNLLLRGSECIGAAIDVMTSLFDARKGILVFTLQSTIVRELPEATVISRELPSMETAPELVIAQALMWMQNAFDYMKVMTKFPEEGDQAAYMQVFLEQQKKRVIFHFRRLATELGEYKDSEDMSCDKAAVLREKYNRDRIFYFNRQVVECVRDYLPRKSEKEVFEDLKEVRTWSALLHTQRCVMQLDFVHKTFSLKRPCAVPSIALLVDSVLGLISEGYIDAPDTRSSFPSSSGKKIENYNFKEASDVNSIKSRALTLLERFLGVECFSKKREALIKEFELRASKKDLTPTWWQTCPSLTLSLFKAYCIEFIKPKVLIPAQLSYGGRFFEEPIRNAYEVTQGVLLPDNNFFVTFRAVRSAAPTNRDPHERVDAHVVEACHNLESLCADFPRSQFVCVSLLSDRTAPKEPDNRMNAVMRQAIVSVNTTHLANQDPSRVFFGNVPLTSKYANTPKHDAADLLAKFQAVQDPVLLEKAPAGCMILFKEAYFAIKNFAPSVTPVKKDGPFVGLSEKAYQKQREVLRQQYHNARLCLARLKFEFMLFLYQKPAAERWRDPAVVCLARTILALDAVLHWKVAILNQHDKRGQKKDDPACVLILTAIELLNGGYGSVQHSQTMLALEMIVATHASVLSLEPHVYEAFCKSGKDRTGNLFDLISILVGGFCRGFFTTLAYDKRLEIAFKTLFLERKTKVDFMQVGWGIIPAVTFLLEETETEYQKGCQRHEENDVLRKYVPFLYALRDAMAGMTHVPTEDLSIRAEDPVRAGSARSYFEAVIARTHLQAEAAFMANERGANRGCYGIVPNLDQDYHLGTVVGTWRKDFCQMFTWMAKQNKQVTCKELGLMAKWAREKERAEIERERERGIRPRVASAFAPSSSLAASATESASGSARASVSSREEGEGDDDGYMVVNLYDYLDVEPGSGAAPP